MQGEAKHINASSPVSAIWTDSNTKVYGQHSTRSDVLTNCPVTKKKRGQAMQVMLYSYKGRHQRRNKTKYLICSILMCLFAVLLMVSIIMLVKEHSQRQREKTAFEDLSAIVNQPEPISYFNMVENSSSDADNDMETEPDRKTILAKYAELYSMNPDLIGWLKIENAGIDLPVMFTPEDPQYYLRRAFDKTDSQSGTPFVGKDGTIDSDCLIIYSHNMKNDTMFGLLDSYADEEFWQENMVFAFDSIYAEQQYEVFAAVECSILNEGEDGFRYYNYSGDLTRVGFNELVYWLTEQAEYDTGIIPTYGEQILILSTCSYHTNNGRFIVAARRSE